MGLADLLYGAFRGVERAVTWVVAWGTDILGFYGPFAVVPCVVFVVLVCLLRNVRNSWQSRTLGYVLLLAGIVSGAGSLGWLCVAALGAEFGGGGDAMPALLLLTSSPFGIVLGWMLASGRKTLVLFLRRFGNEALNDAIRDLVRKRFRARIRLVTLDDSAFSPAGPRWRGLGLSLLPAAALLPLTLSLFPLLSGEVRGEGMFGGAASLVLFLLISVSYVAAAAFLAFLVAAVRSHFVSRLRVRDERSMRRVLRRVRGLRMLVRAPVIFSALATVVTVTDALWQATVAAFSRACDLALLDITHPRPHIGWELKTLRASNVRVILLAQRDGLDRWWQEGSPDGSGAHAVELRELAAALPLVVYDAPAQIEKSGLVERVLAV